MKKTPWFKLSCALTLTLSLLLSANLNAAPQKSIEDALKAKKESQKQAKKSKIKLGYSVCWHSFGRNEDPKSLLERVIPSLDTSKYQLFPIFTYTSEPDMRHFGDLNKDSVKYFLNIYVESAPLPQDGGLQKAEARSYITLHGLPKGNELYKKEMEIQKANSGAQVHAMKKAYEKTFDGIDRELRYALKLVK